MLADASLPIRLATSLSILRIVSKGLKEPTDKLQLIKVLSLGQVLDALESKTRQQQIERGDDTDEGEESYREALGRMLNVLGLEIMKLVEVWVKVICLTWLMLIQQRIQGLMKSRTKQPRIWSKSCRSCCGLWRMNMMIQLQQSSHYCKSF